MPAPSAATTRTPRRSPRPRHLGGRRRRRRASGGRSRLRHDRRGAGGDPAGLCRRRAAGARCAPRIAEVHRRAARGGGAARAGHDDRLDRGGAVARGDAFRLPVGRRFARLPAARRRAAADHATTTAWCRNWSMPARSRRRRPRAIRTPTSSPARSAPDADELGWTRSPARCGRATASCCAATG